MVAKLSQRLLKICTAAVALTALTGAAQEPDADPFHWAYAASLGAGVYRLDDGTESQTYRGNFSVRLRESEEDRLGIRLLLPVAVGVQNLDDDLLPPDRATDRVEHAAFMPGVELEQLFGKRWTMRTRAQLGYAEALEGIEQSAVVGAVGVRGSVAFAEAAGRPAVIAGVLWTGFDPDLGERRSLLRATVGIEFDVRAARWRVRDSPMRWRPHVLKDWYYRPPPALAFGDADVERLDEEWQVGIAAAREERFRILFFEFDAVGVAYRFSEHSNGIRLYLNSAF